MKRKIIGKLIDWKNSKYRKQLILQGARQVGKTYAVLDFGRTYYGNVAYFNFETNPALTDTFNEDISPAALLPVLSHISGQTITKGHTLIVFHMLTIYPMDMEEFLEAVGEDELLAGIREHFISNAAMPVALHTAAMQRYHQYLVVGGMPEAVAQFAATSDYILIRHMQDTLLAGYLDDMSKYNTANEIKNKDYV